MSLIRPQARAALWRWREVLAGTGAVALGLWWVIGGAGIVPWLGWVLIAAALALVLAGVQRGRFRTGAGGPGVVVVDEGLIAYLGPHTGGTVALSEMTALALDAQGPRRWRLSQPGQPDLDIPLDAEGAEALFDAFAALPGLRSGQIVAAMRRPAAGEHLLWERSGQARARPRLH
ncbi:hypothetical protein [Roseovarius ramblicola]|uniref:Uncharacterized protein n=1 Tax=Roseovarius ramblicola TaxID=2022336 RepID=A0ABV5HWS1_9RHOB